MRWTFALVLLCFGCRDVEPFRPVELDPVDPARLTYNVKDDRAPAWTNSSDSVVYVAESFPPFKATNGIALQVPRAGGIAQPVLGAIQSNARQQPWLNAPAVSPDGHVVAFFEMTDVAQPSHCDTLSPWGVYSPGAIAETHTILQQAVLRVRRTDNVAAADNAQLTVNFSGRTLDTSRHPFGLLYVIVNVAYPFQRLYERDGAQVFRASWSPDGSKLVYSDGLQLYIWTVGSSAPTAIPNTNDAVFPAWSPDGNTIAFTQLQRGPTQTMSYTCWILTRTGYSPVENYEITFFDIGDRGTGTLMLINPDGTSLRSMGAGEAPAWSPDSKSVVVHRNGSLARIDVATGAETSMENTQQGFEPAVSRDGKWVAFAKMVTQHNYDIWVAPF